MNDPFIKNLALLSEPVLIERITKDGQKEIWKIQRDPRTKGMIRQGFILNRVLMTVSFKLHPLTVKYCLDFDTAKS